MEKREDLNSILPFLPLILRSSSLFWPSKALESLKALALGPDVSRVDSGEVLFDAILDLRDSIGLSSERLASRAADGYALFFDELMSRVDSRVWFGEVIPGLARLLRRLPSLLETHYQNADEVFGGGKAGLRIMTQQEAGIVFLSQELIAALLACALFCLFATSERSVRYLPLINFDCLFAALHPHAKRSQEQKIKCIVHYFEKICLCMPMGFVSFERKVLPLKQSCHGISYPEAAFWRKSTVSLCPFEVFSSGLIEDQQYEAKEVDFANEYLGGGALNRGCVQEEIRFMINPELIVGMLFMASMGCNEAIEIVGVERFSCYVGYGSSFCFVGDYLDKKPCDSIGRKKTRIVAIDAVCSPGMMQYEVDFLVRETNKAFCGFLDSSKYQHCSKIFQDADENNNEVSTADCNIFPVCETNTEQAKDPDNSENVGASNLDLIGKIENKSCQVTDPQVDIGIATGNWGCGAFGGDPEIKSMIQWLAASQALRPFIHYYTFGEAALQRLEQVTRWILLHGWTVGDLWSMVVEYSFQRLRGETNAGFLTWLLPDHSTSNDMQYRSEQCRSSAGLQKQIMALQCPLLLNCSTPVLREETHPQIPLPSARFVPLRPKSHGSSKLSSAVAGGFVPRSPKLVKNPGSHRVTCRFHRTFLHATTAKKVRASKAIEVVLGDGKDEEDTDSDEEEKSHGNDDGPSLMTLEERKEMRRKIREVLDNAPDVEEETDPVQRKIKMQRLLADYPLVVEEDDPDWPEDADGWGFNFDQFFDKITIKHVRKDDDEDYDGDKEIVWQDDNYIRPIRDITAREWEDTVFKDFNPLIILVHHRYKRPEENERARNELERAVQMFWESGLPSPRCVAVDACVEHDLVDALQVSGFPEILFTHAGKILHREKVVRTADEWSKVMAFFFYKAVRPSFLDKSVGQSREKIPSLK